MKNLLIMKINSDPLPKYFDPDVDIFAITMKIRNERKTNYFGFFFSILTIDLILYRRCCNILWRAMFGSSIWSINLGSYKDQALIIIYISCTTIFYYDVNMYKLMICITYFFFMGVFTRRWFTNTYIKSCIYMYYVYFILFFLLTKRCYKFQTQSIYMWILQFIYSSLIHIRNNYLIGTTIKIWWDI